MKKTNIIGSNFKRVFAALLDISIVLLSTMLVFTYIAEPIVSSTTNIKEVREEYYSKAVEYKVMVWNEQLGTYVDNNEATKIEIDSFKKDERVIQLESQIARISLVQLSSSFFIATIIFYFVLPLVTKNGKTIGKIAMNLRVISLTNDELNKKQLIIRQSSFVVIELILGLLTYGMLPLISLAMVMFSEKGLSIHDYLAKTKIIIKEKEEIIDEEDDEYYKQIIEEEQPRDLRVRRNENDK